MEFSQLNDKQIATILAALRLFQRESANYDMVEAFPEHFQDGAIEPLSTEEIDSLCEEIMQIKSLAIAWNQIIANLNAEDDTPLARLTLYLNYAVEDGDLSHDQALDVLQGERMWIFGINRSEDRGEALQAFEELEALGLNQFQNSYPVSRTFSSEGIKDTAYVTREFVRQDCGIHGARLSDADCDVIIAEVERLASVGKFSHSGVYWIANRLAAEGRIHPSLPH